MYFLSTTALFLFFAWSSLSSQAITGGLVLYEQIIDYQLDGAYDDPRWDSYIENLPRQGKSYHLLSFTQNQSLYKADDSKRAIQSEQLKTAIEKVNYSKTPAPKTKQIFHNFEEQEQMKQMEFMTRSFLVTSSIGAKPWKLTARKKKILNYVCMGADLTIGDETITAWFTPQIPIAAGPEQYHGLPGLILGLEKNDAIFLLATEINLTSPEEDFQSKLDKGQELSEPEFLQLVKEKQASYLEDRKAMEKSSKKLKKY